MRFFSLKGSSSSDQAPTNSAEEPFFQGLLEHAGVEGQFGDEELESAIFGFEF